MLEKLDRIIAEIPLHVTIYLSNFTPKDIFESLREKGYLLKLLPSTLEGLIDTKRLTPFDEEIHFIYTPFFHNNSDLAALEAMQATHHFKLHTLLPDTDAGLQTIQNIYQEGLAHSKDLSLGAITSAECYIIYLAPYLFCPKDDILVSLKQKGVTFHTHLKGLYQEPYFDKVRQEHLTAHECRLSFIALDCKISKEQAALNVKAILETLDDHKLRRCSF